MNPAFAPERQVIIPGEKVELPGSLTIPDKASGIVLFAHGSGSSRHSPRNNYVAAVLRQYGLATLLMDLLTLKEERIYEMRFDIDLLAGRLQSASNWLLTQPETKNLPLGYFGASTGAAAAIEAAALDDRIRAVVSRGGRPDMAGPYLPRLKAPILLLVGGYDDEVIKLNEQACEKIKAVKQLEIIPGATHLFEEPGTLEKAAALAAAWFQKYLSC